MKNYSVRSSSGKIGALALCLLGQSAIAGTITWGGGFSSTNYNASSNDLQSEDTAAVAGGNVTFELGIFQNTDGSEFTPELSNIEMWMDRFVPITDADTPSPTSSYVTSSNISRGFGGTVEVGANTNQVQTLESSSTGGSLVEGFRVYIWGYDTKTIDETQLPEWFLVTGTGTDDQNNWVLPDSDESNNGTFEKTWDIASATTAVVGRIDDNIGEGEMMDPMSPFGNSDLQFATVPEPSSVLLLLLASTGVLRRRRTS